MEEYENHPCHDEHRVTYGMVESLYRTPETNTTVCCMLIILESKFKNVKKTHKFTCLWGKLHIVGNITH